jgi:bifunctional UDP-N-acetylglucosamine pyrophosphorylase/glucosamine-1-phosphate N-acetyltransferase
MGEWHAVILAGGNGSRMGGDLPKVLNPICGVPMIRLMSDAIRNAGITDTIVVVPDEHEDIRAVLPEDTQFAIQHSRLGTGDAVLRSLDLIDKDTDPNIVVVNADVPLLKASTIRSLLEVHLSSKAVMSLVTATGSFSESLGSISRDDDECVISITEGDRLSETVKHHEINVGLYCFRVDWLVQNILRLKPAESGEFYVTDLVELARRGKERVADLKLEDKTEAVGVNTLSELADADELLRARIRNYWIDRGVYMMDRRSVHIDWNVTIGSSTSILPNTIILGEASIGGNCEIGPGSFIRNSHIGSQCKIMSSVIEEAIIENSVDIGPFSHLRGGAYVEAGVHIGNYAEVKASRIGQGTKMGHFSYMGDADVGSNVNIGAGTVTCNFDGDQKYRTIIGNNVFLGSDTMLVAPVEIGDRSRTGAGAVVTKDVPEDVLVAGIPARIVPKPD